MDYQKKFELVGQVEGTLNKMCFAYDSNCNGCPCNTAGHGKCELQRAVDCLYVLLGPRPDSAKYANNHYDGYTGG